MFLANESPSLRLGDIVILNVAYQEIWSRRDDNNRLPMPVLVTPDQQADLPQLIQRTRAELPQQSD